MTAPADLVEKPFYGTWYIAETPLTWCREVLRQHFEDHSSLLRKSHLWGNHQTRLNEVDILRIPTEEDPLISYVDEVVDTAVMGHHASGAKTEVFEALASFRERAKEIIAALQAMRTDNLPMKLLAQGHFQAFAVSIQDSFWGLSNHEKRSYRHEVLQPLAILRDELFWGWSREGLEAYFQELNRLRALSTYGTWRAHAVATGDSPSEEKLLELEDELDIFSTWDSLTDSKQTKQEGTR